MIHMRHEFDSPSSDEQSIDASWELLADSRRRIAVSVLAERESPVALVDLARDVAARENETDPRDVPADRVESVAVSLHHRHLPKLADHGVVTYDVERKAACIDQIDSVSQYVSASEN